MSTYPPGAVFPHVAWIEYLVESSPACRLAEDVFLECEIDGFTAVVRRSVARFIPTRHFGSESEARTILEPQLRAWELSAAITHVPGVIEFRFGNSRMREKPPGPGHLDGVALMMFGGAAMPIVTLDFVPEPPKAFAMNDLVESLGLFYLQSKKTPAMLLHMAYAMTTCVEHYLEDFSTAAVSFGISRAVFEKLEQISSTRGKGVQVRKFPVAGKPAPAPLADLEREWVEKILKLIVERAGAAVAGVTSLPEINLGTNPLQ